MFENGEITSLGFALFHQAYLDGLLEKKLAIEKEVSENKQIFNSIKSEQIRGITVRRRNKEINFKECSPFIKVYSQNPIDIISNYGNISREKAEKMLNKNKNQILCILEIDKLNGIS